MKNKTLSIAFLSLFLSLLLLPSCETAEDLQGIAALRNVNFSMDSLSIDFDLPQGALSGQSFDELLSQDAETYSNPANYGLDLTSHYFADNTSSNAANAKFDGMTQDVVFNGIDENPLRLNTPAFEIPRNQTKSILTHGGINLQTHREAGLYIFRQTVDGLPVSTSILTALLYKIGNEEGAINLPEVHYDIPTRASDEMKAFLSELLESGIFDE